jgi:hypothetical protein
VRCLRSRASRRRFWKSLPWRTTVRTTRPPFENTHRPGSRRPRPTTSRSCLAPAAGNGAFPNDLPFVGGKAAQQGHHEPPAGTLAIELSNSSVMLRTETPLVSSWATASSVRRVSRPRRSSLKTSSCWKPWRRASSRSCLPRKSDLAHGALRSTPRRSTVHASIFSTGAPRSGAARAWGSACRRSW